MGTPTDRPIGEANRSSECYGRTDGPTETPIKLGTHAQLVDAGAHIDDLVKVGEVIEAGELWQRPDRHEVVRAGEREPIPSHVRAAVMFRDRFQCARCPQDYPSGDPLHLDHIKPWSAGGADTTDNLRLLCERHNIERSNFVDFARPKRPATWWCANCYDINQHTWTYSRHVVACPVHPLTFGPKAWCRVVRRYWQEFERTGEVATWHQVPMLTTFETVAYCAHCDAPGMTGRPL